MGPTYIVIVMSGAAGLVDTYTNEKEANAAFEAARKQYPEQTVYLATARATAKGSKS